MIKLHIFLTITIIQLFFVREVHAMNYCGQRSAKRMALFCGSCNSGPFPNKSELDWHDCQDETESEIEESHSKRLACPFKDLCKRANSEVPFQTILTLYMHIVSMHVECPYGETFGYCSKWNEIKNQLIKSLKDNDQLSDNIDLLKSELRVPLQDHVQACHEGNCRDGRCSYIRACGRCKGIVTLAKTRFKNHHCVQKIAKKTLTQNYSSKDEAVLYEHQACREDDSIEDDVSTCSSNDDYLSSEEDNYVSDLQEDSIVKIIITSRENQYDEGKSDFKRKGFLFSCWSEKHHSPLEKIKSIEVSHARYCCTFFSDQAEAMKHLQKRHNICFECLKEKAFFKEVEDLIRHERAEHQGEVPRKSKCATYGDQKVCLLCVVKDCQYKSPEELQLHMEQKH